MFLLLLIAGLFSSEESVIVYTAKGCRPCAELKRDYEKDPELFGDREVFFVDVTREPVKGVRVVPTFVLLDGYEEKDRRVGYGGPDSIQRWLK